MLSDYGIEKLIEANQPLKTQNLYYPPEILQISDNQFIGVEDVLEKCDISSLGILILKSLTGLSNEEMLKLCEQSAKGIGQGKQSFALQDQLNSVQPPELQLFIQYLINPNWKMRMGIEKAIVMVKVL